LMSCRCRKCHLKTVSDSEKNSAESKIIKKYAFCALGMTTITTRPSACCRWLQEVVVDSVCWRSSSPHICRVVGKVGEIPSTKYFYAKLHWKKANDGRSFVCSSLQWRDTMTFSEQPITAFIFFVYSSLHSVQAPGWLSLRKSTALTKTHVHILRCRNFKKYKKMFFESWWASSERNP